jgi:UDP-N-acetyl-D-galactosamine dehydrogenase
MHLRPMEDLRDLDALILTVAHDAYASIPLAEIRGWFRNPDKALLVDVKGFFDRKAVQDEGMTLWRL